MYYIYHFSTLPNQRANNDFPLTATILNLTPGISPTACPFLPNPATVTSSFSFKKLRQPSFGTKADIFLPFFFNNTLQHFLTAEFGYLDSLLLLKFNTLQFFQQPILLHVKHP